MVLIFIATFFVGGMNFVSAYTNSVSFNLDADFLSTDFTSAKQKLGISEQRVIVTKTADDREVLLAIANQNNTILGAWMTSTTGDVLRFIDSRHKAPTIGDAPKYKLATKLALPWFQTNVYGTWIIDL